MYNSTPPDWDTDGVYQDDRGIWYKPCIKCGGYMTWCSGCEMWSETCCEEYGTCMCS